MAKLVPLPTRAFGAEPGVPDVTALAGWIAEHRGESADLMAYQLDVSLAPQLAAGITSPCAGGLFCRERVVGSLTGLNENCDRITGEIDSEGRELAEDAAMLAARKKNVWCALPAPSALGLTDEYYHNEDERGDAIAAAYRRIMREMRDAGTGGHILIAETAVSGEIEALARRNVFFFVPDSPENDLEILMEYQRGIAVRPALLVRVFDLFEEYGHCPLVIMDPDEDAIKSALLHLDPDQVIAGGYNRDSREEYWQNLVCAAAYRR